MSDSNLIKVKEVIEEILRIIGFEGEALVSDQQDGLIEVNIKNDQARYLIGRNGENLIALQHILRAIASKQFLLNGLVIDINGYQKNRLEELKGAALLMADEVVRRQSSRSLTPMNAFERRQIHLALVDFKGVEAVSEGEGEARHVVIKPAKQL